MSKILDDYIEEIDHYLTVKGEKSDILREIRSHLLERLQNMGEPGEDALPRLLRDYGSPKEVADRYNEAEEVQIIAPSLKGYLIRYTLFLFSLHTLLTVAAVLTKSSMILAPFFVIPRMDPLTALNFIPMNFIYDAGLVGLVFYFITQKRKYPRLPWLKLDWERLAGGEPAKPKAGALVLPALLLVLALAAYVTQKTIFFYSLSGGAPRSFLNPEYSGFLSLIVIGLLAVELVTKILRFFTGSPLPDILANALWLGGLWWIINVPGQGLFHPEVPRSLVMVLKPAGIIVLVVAAVFSAWGFLKGLLRLLFRLQAAASPAEEGEG
jgi:hypothetical protein